ncbi:MAG: helix-turn-helix domain-containing protein [Actinobacteria bacterium]|nr:helix-turn-helix domain-containing protein [Actinomycetota bacterium]
MRYFFCAMLTSMSPSVLVRDARKRAGLTQAELAERAGVTQSVIARLERGGGNPTFLTLERVLHAAGHRLELNAVHQGLRTVDETLIAQQLALSPGERIRALDAHLATADVLLNARVRRREQHA